MDFIIVLFMDFIQSMSREAYFFLFMFSFLLNIVGMVLVNRYKKLVDQLEKENLDLESYIFMENYGDEHTKRI